MKYKIYNINPYISIFYGQIMKEKKENGTSSSSSNQTTATNKAKNERETEDFTQYT